MRLQGLPDHRVASAAPAGKAALRPPSQAEIDQYTLLERIVSLLGEWFDAEPPDSVAAREVRIAIDRLVRFIPPTILARSTVKFRVSATSAQAQPEGGDYVVRNLGTDPNAGRLLDEVKATILSAKLDRAAAEIVVERREAENRPQALIILAAVNSMVARAADMDVKRALGEFVAQEQFRFQISDGAIADVQKAYDAKAAKAGPTGEELRRAGYEEMIPILENFAEQTTDPSMRAELLRVIERIRGKAPVPKSATVVARR